MNQAESLFQVTVGHRTQFGGFLSFMNQLPNPDEVLRRAGKTTGEYKVLTYDSHVQATVMSRKANVLSREIVFEADTTESAAYLPLIQYLTRYVDWIALKDSILNAVLYGYTPIEIVYEFDTANNLITPVRIDAKAHELFVFDELGNLRLMADHKPLPPYKFICPRHEGTFENPYGEALLARIFWVVEFKRNALQYWMKAASRFAVPSRVGYAPDEADDTDVDSLADTLVALSEDNAAALRGGYRIEQLSGDTTDASNTFSKLIDVCNAEISKAILGQTLTTEIGSVGSYAAAEVHSAIRREIVEYDQRLCERSIEELLRYITELNNIPGRFRAKLVDSEQVRMNIAQRDSVLKSLGVQFTAEYIAETYNIAPRYFTV